MDDVLQVCRSVADDGGSCRVVKQQQWSLCVLCKYMRGQFTRSRTKLRYV
jgi:hypothetical protein